MYIHHASEHVHSTCIIDHAIYEVQLCEYLLTIIIVPHMVAHLVAGYGWLTGGGRLCTPGFRLLLDTAHGAIGSIQVLCSDYAISCGYILFPVLGNEIYIVKRVLKRSVFMS